MPTTCRSLTAAYVAAPIPAPPISGHCKLHVVSTRAHPSTPEHTEHTKLALCKSVCIEAAVPRRVVGLPNVTEPRAHAGEEYVHVE
jgi:hypothetical protein